MFCPFEILMSSCNCQYSYKFLCNCVLVLSSVFVTIFVPVFISVFLTVLYLCLYLYLHFISIFSGFPVCVVICLEVIGCKPYYRISQAFSPRFVSWWELSRDIGVVPEMSKPPVD